jgi:hypothetical protein
LTLPPYSRRGSTASKTTKAAPVIFLGPCQDRHPETLRAPTLHGHPRTPCSPALWGHITAILVYQSNIGVRSPNMLIIWSATQMVPAKVMSSAAAAAAWLKMQSQHAIRFWIGLRQVSATLECAMDCILHRAKHGNAQLEKKWQDFRT